MDMNFLSQIDDSDVERAEDQVGGGFHRLDSDIYLAKIKTVFAGESQSGAMYVTCIFDINGQEYRETLYISNRNKEVFYRTRNNKKAPIPGYAIFKNLCIICTGKEPNKLSTDEKMVKVWDFETGLDQLKSVPVVTELTGKEVALGIIKELRNKRRKNAAGEYVDVPEYNELNAISAVFHPTKKLTVNEAIDHKPAQFWDKWLEANQGKVRDRRTIKEDAGTSAGSEKPKNYSSVFDN